MEFHQSLKKDKPKIKPGKYRHYKGKYYKVIGLAHHSETLEELVVYRALYYTKEFGKNSLWVRPAKMFLGNVKVRDKIMPRFKYLLSYQSKN